jgi:hypothetical protein
MRRDANGEREKVDCAAVDIEPFEVQGRSVHVHLSAAC